MTGADAADRAPYDLVGILSVASAALDSGGHYAAFAADHLVMAYPIKSGDERVGTLAVRSEEHTSELQSLMRISYAVFCLKKKKNNTNQNTRTKYTTNMDEKSSKKTGK